MGTIGQIGLAAAAVGDAELSRRCHGILAPTAHWYAADGGGAPFYHGSNEYTVGALALSAGELGVAMGHFERAIDANLRIGARPFVSLARLGLAQCSSRRPDLSPAGPQARAALVRELAAEAAEEFRLLDMPGPLAEAERLMSQARPQAAPEHALTARELEVARLVATARTNQQIADHLFLSVRTVESHVRGALAKLQLGTRTELALWVRGRPDS
jgi:DNA-binding CsgD family transcriptional regulator